MYLTNCSSKIISLEFTLVLFTKMFSFLWWNFTTYKYGHDQEWLNEIPIFHNIKLCYINLQFCSNISFLYRSCCGAIANSWKANKEQYLCIAMCYMKLEVHKMKIKIYKTNKTSLNEVIFEIGLVLDKQLEST